MDDDFNSHMVDALGYLFQSARGGGKSRMREIAQFEHRRGKKVLYVEGHGPAHELEGKFICGPVIEGTVNRAGKPADDGGK